VDSVGNRGYGGSLGIGASGRLHAVYWDVTNHEIRYASCDLDCTEPASWTTTTIGETGIGVDNAVIAEDGTGRLHAAWYWVNFGLQYATCSSSCSTGANWTVTGVAETGGLHASMVVDGSNGIHISHHETADDDLAYSTCAAQCSSAANWTTLALDQTGTVGGYTGLALDADRRLHVVYYDFTNGDLKYATCAAVCTAGASWRSAAVDQGGDVGAWASTALDAAGRLHTIYYDATAADLKYVR
jgi:hypothetical protein